MKSEGEGLLVWKTEVCPVRFEDDFMLRCLTRILCVHVSDLETKVVGEVKHVMNV